MLEEPAPLRERYGNSWIPRPSSARPREGPRGASVNRRPGIGSRVRSVAPRSNGSARESSGSNVAGSREAALQPHRVHPPLRAAAEDSLVRFAAGDTSVTDEETLAYKNLIQTLKLSGVRSPAMELIDRAGSPGNFRTA